MNYSHLNANGTTVLTSVGCKLHTVSINTKGAAANTLTLYDGTVAQNVIIAIIDTVNLATNVLVYDVDTRNGLTAVMATGTAADVTISFG